MTTHHHPLTISKVAKLAGIGVETVRYYQRIGLIDEPPKPPQGYREYPRATISRLNFIHRAKQLGFTLAEISDLLQLTDAECATTQLIAEHKVNLIKEKVTDLQAMAVVLEELLESCKANQSQGHCPIIEVLSKD